MRNITMILTGLLTGCWIRPSCLFQLAKAKNVVLLCSIIKHMRVISNGIPPERRLLKTRFSAVC